MAARAGETKVSSPVSARGGSAAATSMEMEGQPSTGGRARGRSVPAAEACGAAASGAAQVAQEHDAGTVGRRLHELQRDLAALVEEPLSAPEDERIDQQVELVDEPLLEEASHQRQAAVDEDVLARLLLEAGHLPGHVLAQQVRVVPVERLERR